MRGGRRAKYPPPIVFIPDMGLRTNDMGTDGCWWAVRACPVPGRRFPAFQGCGGAHRHSRSACEFPNAWSWDANRHNLYTRGREREGGGGSGQGGTDWGERTGGARRLGVLPPSSVPIFWTVWQSAILALALALALCLQPLLLRDLPLPLRNLPHLLGNLPLPLQDLPLLLPRGTCHCSFRPFGSLQSSPPPSPSPSACSCGTCPFP